jgi:ParB/RepB/Spo0J family partition protein
MTMNDENTMTMPIEDLDEFALNPRRGIYRCMATLIADIRERGIIQPLVVWFNKRTGRYNVLQGNRRRRAAVEIGLSELPVILRAASDEAEALKLCMVLQLEGDDFDPLEEAIGVRSLLDLDSSPSEIGSALHRNETWVQLRLDALKLPDAAQDALARHQMDWGTVERLMRVDEEERGDAVHAVLQPELGLPLQGEAAHRLIEQEWIERSDARRLWVAQAPGLRKKFPGKRGFSVLENFSDWATYSTNAYGQPQAGFRHADEMIDRRELRDAEQRVTWGELARQHEHAVHVIPAWKSKDGYVLLVNERVIRDAEAVVGEAGGECVLKMKPGRGGQKSEVRGQRSDHEVNEEEQEHGPDVTEGGEGWTLEILDEPNSRRWFATLEGCFDGARALLEVQGALAITIHAGPLGEASRAE